MSDKIRLAVAVMAYGGQISSYHAAMWMEVGRCLFASHERFELGAFICVDTNPVDRARNFALATAMQTGCTWLLMIDADTWVEAARDQPDQDAGLLLLRMISDADRAGAWIVAAPVQRRIVPGMERKLMAYRDSLANEPLGVGELGRMQEIEAAATAVMAMRLEPIAEHGLMFKFTDERAEDMEMCRAVRALGGKILLDGRVRTGHLSKSVPLYSNVKE